MPRRSIEVVTQDQMRDILKAERKRQPKNENGVSNDIRKVVEDEFGGLSIRVNSGAFKLDGGRGFVQGAKKGTSDRINIIPVKVGKDLIIGIFVAIEAKHGRNTPSDEQEQFLADVRQRGGVGFVAYSGDEARLLIVAEIQRLMQALKKLEAQP